MQLGANYDLEYVCVSPVFDKLKWAQNSCAEFTKRQPGKYVVCDVRTNQSVERKWPWTWLTTKNAGDNCGTSW